MGKIPELSTETRAQIGILFKQGMKQVDISTLLKIPQGTISKTIKIIKSVGAFESRSRTGRPRVTSSQTDRMIRRYAVAKPTASSSEIQASLPTTVPKPCTSTIRRRLAYEFNLRAYKPAKKCKLSLKNIRDRVEFCKRHRQRTSNEWKNVMFSDETMISQFRSFSPFVRRPPNKRYNCRYIIPTVKHPETVMVWGAITAHGRAGIWFCPKDTKVNASVYLDILKETIGTFMHIHNTTIFQQDGAPCHTAQKVKSWIKDQPFQLLENWPGSSPDLNIDIWRRAIFFKNYREMKL